MWRMGFWALVTGLLLVVVSCNGSSPRIISALQGTEVNFSPIGATWQVGPYFVIKAQDKDGSNDVDSVEIIPEDREQVLLFERGQFQTVPADSDFWIVLRSMAGFGTATKGSVEIVIRDRAGTVASMLVPYTSPGNPDRAAMPRLSPTDSGVSVEGPGPIRLYGKNSTGEYIADRTLQAGTYSWPDLGFPAGRGPDTLLFLQYFDRTSGTMFTAGPY